MAAEEGTQARVDLDLEFLEWEPLSVYSKVTYWGERLYTIRVGLEIPQL